MSGAETTAEGGYVLSGLTTGTYRLEFSIPSGEHAFEYYEDELSVEDARDIAVTSGTTTAGIDASLGIAGKISGTVTSAADGSPVAGVGINVYRGAGGQWQQVWVGAESADDGTYTLGGLPSGAYRIEFFDWTGQFASEFYDGKPSLQSATVVSVKAGRTTQGIDPTLDPMGSISGTVTSAADGSPIEGAYVTAFRKVGKSWEWTWDAETGEDGGYSLGNLPAGAYRLEIYDPSGAFAGEFYDDSDSLERATNVAVTAGAATSGVDVTLEPGARISGTLSSALGSAARSGRRDRLPRGWQLVRGNRLRRDAA